MEQSVENMLPSFELSENDLFEIAISEPLEVKIQKAIALLKAFEPNAMQLDQGGYYLCNSGGKDSGVIRHLAVLSGVKFTEHYNLTTLDPPELVHFMRRTYPNIITHKRPVSLLARAVETANPPTRLARWCCLEYKEQRGAEQFKIIGVRALESARRKGLWRQMVPNRNNIGFFLCIILNWSEKDVWDFHRQYNLPYCELYDKGHKRLGCIGCPLAGAKGIEEDFKYWPKYEQMWRKMFVRLWDRWHGIPNKKGEPRFFEKFGNPQAFYEWWKSGNAMDKNEMCQGEFMFSMDNMEGEEE